MTAYWILVRYLLFVIRLEWTKDNDNEVVFPFGNSELLDRENAIMLIFSNDRKESGELGVRQKKEKNLMVFRGQRNKKQG